MGEHSASYRDGAGSNPASGPDSANPGYAASQLAKALATAEHHEDEETRERAKQKVAKWLSVFNGIVSGSFRIGSRTPLGGVPVWATPEVVTGGFVTGTLLASGPLREHERAFAAEFGLSTNTDDRLALNRHFLSDEGLNWLQARLSSGTYGVGVPEEGTLLVVAWLIRNGYADAARDLLGEIGPHFSQLRFYPEPTDRARITGARRVCMQSVGETIDKLKAVKPSQEILKQREAIEVWIPVYDELVALMLETVEGEPPDLARNADATTVRQANGFSQIVGGWPCRTFPNGWTERAADLAERFDRLRVQHVSSSRPHHRKSSLAQLMPFLRKLVADRESLTGRDVGRIRQLLARYVAKRGLPSSIACLSARERQVPQANTPLFDQVADVVLQRLSSFEPTEGIDDLTPVTSQISAEEAALCRMPLGSELPTVILHTVERSLSDTMEVLVQRGLIPSGEVLARVLPQVTADLLATAYPDSDLRRLQASIYRAFRRRRSLLLLNLQSQVKIEELPWVDAVKPFRNDVVPQEFAREMLTDLVRLALTSFPYAILPNKLLQELRALAETAKINVPIVDELAADIFVGEFSEKYTLAAKKAAHRMRGTLYETYYGINYEEVSQIPLEESQKPTRWQRQSKPHPLMQLCCRRAGVAFKGWDPAGNGMIIE